MAKTIDIIARQLGAKRIAQVLDVDGGAFGAARIARQIVGGQKGSGLVLTVFGTSPDPFSASQTQTVPPGSHAL